MYLPIHKLDDDLRCGELPSLLQIRRCLLCVRLLWRLFRFFLGAINDVSGGLKPSGEADADAVHRSGEGILQRFLLLRWKGAEDVTDERSGTVRSDADAQAGEAVRAEVGNDGFHAVVAAGTAAFAQTQRAEGQGDVIVHHKKLCRSNFEVTGERSHALS